MKKLSTLFIILFTCVGTLFSDVIEHVQIGDLFYNLDTDSRTAEISADQKWSYENYQSLTNVVLPESVEYDHVNYAVTSIGEGAFARSPIQSVAISASILTIGGGAFQECNGLTSVVVPDNVQVLGGGAFHNCGNLKSVSVGSGLTAIGEGIFNNSDNITTVVWKSSQCGCRFGPKVETITFGEEMTAIPGGMCYEMTSLKSITIPTHITTFGNAAFYGCNNIKSVTWNAKNSEAFHFGGQVESFTFGDEVEHIPAGLCSGMILLTTITIPPSVKSIGADAFVLCDNMEEVRISDLSAWCAIEFGNISANPLLYGNALYLNSKRIKDLVVPEGITRIKDYAFAGCTQFRTITLNDETTSIGQWAFSYCWKLESITIPENVTSIGAEAFYESKVIKSVTWKAKNCNGWNFGPQVESVTFGDEVETIPAGLCSGMSLLDTIAFPASVQTIGDNAFQSCSGIKAVHLGNNVTSIGSSAFQGCSALASLTIGAALEQLGNSSFSGCPIAEFTLYAEEKPTGGSISGINPTDCVLYVPAESVEEYEDSKWWKNFKEIKPIVEPEPQPQPTKEECEIIYKDKDGATLDSESFILTLPVLPEIPGFTFLSWDVIGGQLSDGIIIQAIYESDTPTAAPEVINPANPSQKLIRQGNVYILRDDRTYTLTGQNVR